MSEQFKEYVTWTSFWLTLSRRTTTPGNCSMTIERLRPLEKEWRKESDDFERDGDEGAASAYYNCAEQISAILADLGQEVAPVAWLCHGGKVFVDSAHISKAHAERSASNNPGSTVSPLYTSPAHTSEARDADINDLALEQGPDDIPRLTLAGRELAAFPAGTIDKVMDTLSILGGHCVGDSDRLDFMNMHRVALVPEFEGPWDVEVYDEGQMVSVFSGNDTRSALDAAIAAMRQERDTP